MGSEGQYRAGIPIGFQSRNHPHYGQNAIGMPKEYQLSASGAKRPVEVKGWIVIRHMSKRPVEHKSHVASDYAAGICGSRILIVGYSHHWGEGDEKGISHPKVQPAPRRDVGK
ncbi:MAG: hypothetical protein ACHQAQ_00955 [Hyphomicrobiales bacterium]